MINQAENIVFSCLGQYGTLSSLTSKPSPDHNNDAAYENSF